MGHSEVEAAELALEWPPDVLSFECGDTSGFPNGRRLNDDVVAATVQLATLHSLPESARPPVHRDLLPVFPYLGSPNQGRSRQPALRWTAHACGCLMPVSSGLPGIDWMIEGAFRVRSGSRSRVR